MNAIRYLGLLAGILTSGAAIPQVIQTYRTKQARDLSLWQLVMLNLGMFLWLIYGLGIGDLPLILANVFSLVCYSSLVFMKLRYAKRGLEAQGAID